MRPSLLLLSLLVGTLGAAEVLGYRGLDGSGRYPGEGLLEAWPPGGPPQLWQAEPGDGWSNVAVDGERVLIVGGMAATLQTYALADGRPLAEVALGRADWKRFGGARTVPLLHAGMAVAGLPDSTLVGIELASGAERWRRAAWRDFGPPGTGMGWGWPETPLRHGRLVILNTCSRDLATPPLVALDIASGETVWAMAQEPRADGSAKKYSAGDSSGTLFHHQGRALVAYPTWRYLVVLDADSGDLLWELPNGADGGEITLPPVYDPEQGCLIAALRDPPGADGKAHGTSLVRIDLDERGGSPTLRWRRPGGSRDFTFATSAGGRLYCFGDATAPVLAGDGSELIPAPETAIPPGQEKKGRPPTALLCLDLASGALLDQLPAQVREGGHLITAGGLIYAQDQGPGGAAEPPRPERQSPEQALARLAPLRLRLIRPTAAGMEVVGELLAPIRDREELGGARATDVGWHAAIAPVIAQGRLFLRYGALRVYDLRRP